ncbi:ABC transporter ATP-binding protein [Microbacterium alcoholitolerans]|uniref:ABC transporter ATP-binding protein n=1 Tax=unclassified Microbacterium TaxID=2609290 RepID=UPI003D16FB57
MTDTSMLGADGSAASTPRGPVLQVRDLRTRFELPGGGFNAVDGVSFDVEAGRTMCVVGESGCGKSMTSLSIMGLVPSPGKVISGEILLNGRNLAELRPSELRKIRGNEVSMVFQQPLSSLNPSYRVGTQIREVFALHRDLTRTAQNERIIAGLRDVGMPDPEARVKAFPHELSGGMAQRVMIAMALACEPDVLIADEPTTALDVTMQAQILDLIRELQRARGTAVVFITHDLGVVAEIADEVAVMYAGEIVETTGVEALFDNPMHPYTKGLIKSAPMLGAAEERLVAIPGTVPNLADIGPGCRFASRCAARIESGLTICESQHPELREVEPGHSVRCWLYDDSASVSDAVAGARK